MKKSHTPKKGSKRKPHHKKRGLGTTKKSASNRAKGLVSGLVDSGKTLAGHVGGFLGGAFIAKAIDKVPFLAENAADSTMVGYLKKAVKPVVLVGLGTTTRIIGVKKELSFVKALGEGLNVSGAFSAVKTFSKSEIFAGLGSEDESVGDAKQAEYFRENTEALKQIAQENAAGLNLGETTENIDGLGNTVTIPGTQLELADAKMIL
jgi:hypothetical protein